MRKFLVLILAFAISAASCEGTDFDNAGTSSSDLDAEVVDTKDSDVKLASRLVRFDQCDTLLDHIHTEYSQLVGPYGFTTDPIWEPLPLDDDSVVAPGSAEPTELTETADDGSSLDEGVDFSGTNVQELGVDEADIVKTDGKRIFVISDRRLTVVDAASRTATQSAKLASKGSVELLISGDSVLVILRNDYPWRHEEPTNVALPGERSEAPVTIIQRIDVSSDAPKVVSTLRVEGEYLTSRSIDGSARIVLRSDPHLYLPFVHPQNRAGESRARKANLRAVLETTLDDWLPIYSLDDSDWQQLPACANVHTPSEFSGLGLTTVLGLPIDAALDPAGATTVLAPGDIVYASAASLYTTSTARPQRTQPFRSPESSDVENEATTSIHRFDISDPAKAVYVSSGDVAGTIRNQFSLSEHNDYLRVVTTTGDTWGDTSESQVKVLQENGNRLKQISQVGDIGKGENVQSVRFIGDIGYVVTFRQIDPFYTIDLSDPRNPIIRGELKIPGFSSYLHPIGDGLVLGLGADANDEGRLTGAKVSLFDVSDLDDPREIATWTIPNTSLGVRWDHRAFLWWAPENLAVIPIWIHGGWTGAVTFRVADGTITEIGRIGHSDFDDALAKSTCQKLSESDLRKIDTRHDTNFTLVSHDVTREIIACKSGPPTSLSWSRCDNGYWVSSLIRADDLKRLNIHEDSSVWLCFLRHEFIPRGIVISDELWTLSYSADVPADDPIARLQAHDIRTFKRLANINLE